MATCEWLVLCRQASVENGTLSVHALYQVMLPQALPTTLDPAVLAFRIFGEPEEGVRIEIHVHSPDGKATKVGSRDERLPDTGTLDLFSVVREVPIVSTGTYWFSVSLNGAGTPERRQRLEVSPPLSGSTRSHSSV